MDTPDVAWVEQLIRRRDFAAIGAESALKAAVERGHVRRVVAGIYVASAVAESWDADARFRATVHATAMRHPDETFSHFSAAALWRLPNLEPWPARAEAVVDVSTGGRSTEVLRRRAIGRPTSPELVDRVAVTDLARTVVDVGSIGRFSQAVAIADAALAGSTDIDGLDRAPIRTETLHETLTTRVSQRGVTRCRRVIEFADGASGSPGESLSRVAIHMLGFAAPRLQEPFFDDEGLIGYVDFWWPEFGVIGEFDGHGKYLRSELRNGRSIGEVVVAEKRREDRLRALPEVRTVTRWGWVDARSLRRLESALQRAGLSRAGKR